MSDYANMFCPLCGTYSGVILKKNALTKRLKQLSHDRCVELLLVYDDSTEEKTKEKRHNT